MSASAPREKIAAVSAWAPLTIPAFRWLWLAQFASNTGVWMQTVGAQWFLVERTHSSAMVAWVQTASLLPVLLLSLFAGVLADSFDRRRLLLATTALSTVIAGVLTALAFTGALTPWLLLLLTFFLGCSSAMTAPAWQAIQPELVPREQIAAAASLGSVTVNGARAIGPAIAGVLVVVAGPAAVVALNAASFLIVIWALLAWKRPPPAVAVVRERLGPALGAGLRYVRAAPMVRRILLRAALFAFPASALWALLPSALQAEHGIGAGGYGIALGALGVGALVGVAAMPSLHRWLSNNVLLGVSALAFGLGTVAVALWPFPVVLVLLLVAGMAWIATLTTLNASMQLSVAGWVRARGLAVYLLVFMGVQAVGSFLWGALSSLVGTMTVLLVCAAVLALVAATIPLFPLLPETGTLDRTVVALCNPNPLMVFEPQPSDGPVLVVLDYRVAPGNADQFVAAMQLLEKSRRRTGATSWRLGLSGEEPNAFREEFTLRSWGEYQRQGMERWTGYDIEVHDRAGALADAPATVSHYFPVRHG